MMTTKNEFLNVLNNVALAASSDGMPFSDCFVFEKNIVMCFNGAVFAMQKTGLNLNAVLNVKQLLSVIKGLPAGNVEVSATDTDITFRAGTSKNSCVTVQRYTDNAGYTLSDIGLPNPNLFRSISPDTLDKMAKCASLWNDKDDDRIVTNVVCMRGSRIMTGNGPQALCCTIEDDFGAEVLIPRQHLKTAGTNYNKYFVDEKCLYLYNTDTFLLCGIRAIRDSKYPDNDGFDRACGLLPDDNETEQMPYVFTCDAEFMKCLKRLKTTAPDNRAMYFTLSGGVLKLRTHTEWGETTEVIETENKSAKITARYDVQFFIDGISLGGNDVCVYEDRVVFASPGVNMVVAPIG